MANYHHKSSPQKSVQYAAGNEVTGKDDTMFSSPGALSDIILVVEDRKLHVSKCVLGLSSPVFLRMFEGDYKGRTEIPLVDKKYEDVVELLLCIYPSTNKPISEGNIQAVLPLADEYGIDSLKVRCETFYLNLFQLHDERYRDPSNKLLIHVLYLSDKYKLLKLLDVCVDKAKFRMYGINGINSLPEFQLISMDTKFRVVTERLSQLEVSVKGVISNYASQDYARRMANPFCRACIGYEDDCHDEYAGCRLKVAREVGPLMTQLHKLNIQFLKDPRM